MFLMQEITLILNKNEIYINLFLSGNSHNGYQNVTQANNSGEKKRKISVKLHNYLGLLKRRC